MQYAVHTHFQKIPALFGQMAWRKAAGKNRELAMIDYKANASGRTVSFKSALTLLFMPFAFTRRVVLSRVCKVWYAACLREGLGAHLDSSNVILGQVELHGTRNIRLGRNALIYPGVYLETQGAGSITLGNDVVLSRGVHIVAFDNVVIGDGAMVGEYTSIRDADHRLDGASLRSAGHIARPVVIGREVWLGRGVTVLKGVSVADHSVVGANAVVTKSVGTRQVVGGIPARVLRHSEPCSSPTL
jgi:acetyltransferase-like isoleucine patch superfamily enzyme